MRRTRSCNTGPGPGLGIFYCGCLEVGGGANCWAGAIPKGGYGDVLRRMVCGRCCEKDGGRPRTCKEKSETCTPPAKGKFPPRKVQTYRPGERCRITPPSATPMTPLMGGRIIGENTIGNNVYADGTPMVVHALATRMRWVGCLQQET